MLNLYNSLKKTESNITSHNVFKENTIKNFPPSTREWENSIYTFNKNYLNLIPKVSKSAIKLIKSYLYLYSINLENKIRRSNLRKRFRKLSSNRIYVSNGKFKHTNNKVIITLFVYNRQKINFSYFIKKKFKKFFTKQLYKNFMLLKTKIRKHIINLKVNRKIITDLIINEKNETLLKKYNSFIYKTYEFNFLKRSLKRIYKRYKKYFLYKQLLFINKSKFNYNYLSYLTVLLKGLFNKDVQFDIINLKYFYLNSDIFTESLLLKIRKNRRKMLKNLKNLIIKSKISPLNKFMEYKPLEKNDMSIEYDDTDIEDDDKDIEDDDTNIEDDDTDIEDDDMDKIDVITHKLLENLYINKNSVKETVLSLIKYKKTTGVRLEAKGRLTRRYTASRAVSKLGYKGSLINADSSYLNLSSVLLKGNLKSNVQYTKLKSKTRIGSFGLKGWISGY